MSSLLLLVGSVNKQLIIQINLDEKISLYIQYSQYGLKLHIVSQSIYTIKSQAQLS